MRLPTLLRRRRTDLVQDPFERWMREMFEGDATNEAAEARFLPVANVAETDKEWLVTLELPGMDEKEIDVRLHGTQLVVSGERKHEQTTKEKQYHRIETSYGMFERRFELPPEVRAVVVDNASRDGSQHAARRRAYTELLENPVNAGFARGCNQAARHAGGELLLFLNNQGGVALPAHVREEVTQRMAGINKVLGGACAAMVLQDSMGL